MKLYHQSNNPSVVLSGEPGQYDDVELLLSRTSARSKDADVVIQIEIPDDEMDRLMPHGRSKWTTTNAELRRSGAKIDCATDGDRDRAAVYELVARRHKTLETIGRLRHYIAEAEDRPEASRFTMMLRAHQDELTDLDAAIAEGVRRHGIRHLNAYEGISV